MSKKKYKERKKNVKFWEENEKQIQKDGKKKIKVKKKKAWFDERRRWDMNGEIEKRWNEEKMGKNERKNDRD